MAEVFRVFDEPVVDQSGSYHARVVGRRAEDGMWEGWLEFPSLDGGQTFKPQKGYHTTLRRAEDLSYDFINRPAYQHALAMQDTEFLRLTMNLARKAGVDTASLVHALQNHDEMTYELVHFAAAHHGDLFRFRGAERTGADLAGTIRGELIDRLTGPAAPYNSVFTTNGIASTTASVIAASLGITDLAEIDDKRAAEIRKAHLLLTKFNAWQPGVVAFSGWDLCGMLPLERARIRPLLSTGDTRWIHRAAYDLMGYGENPQFLGMPHGRSLYGTLPAQLEDPDSYVCGLREILEIRERSGVATARQLDVPPVSHKGMLVMVHEIEDGSGQHVTVLNFAQEDITGTIRSEHLAPGSSVVDMSSGAEIGEVDDLNSFSLSLGMHDGLSLLVTPPVVADPADGVPPSAD